MENTNRFQLIALVLTILNLIYSVSTGYIDHGTSDSFFLVPFGVPLLLAMILLCLSAYGMSITEKKTLSIVSMVINIIVILVPFSIIIFI